MDIDIGIEKRPDNKLGNIRKMAKAAVLLRLSNLIPLYFITSVFLRQQGGESRFDTKDSWVILSPIEQRIKAKIEAVGVPLANWDVQINYGIKTGFNEAFIINGAKKDELIAQDPKSGEIIRPLLRGRDIKRYAYEFADLYLITTFPSLEIDIEAYPAVKEHLLSFGYDRLKQTGEKGARKKTNNKWFETQDSISYWEDFYRPKIVWGEISDKSKFAFDETGASTTDTTFLMTGNDIKYLLAMLNSKLAEWLFNQIGTKTGEGTNRWKKYTIEQLPVKVPSDRERMAIEQMVDLILKNHEDFDMKKLDKIIFRLYGLSLEEIEFIERM